MYSDSYNTRQQIPLSAQIHVEMQKQLSTRTMSTTVSPTSHTRRRRIQNMNEENGFGGQLLVPGSAAASPDSGGINKHLGTNKTKRKNSENTGNIMPLWLVALLCALFLVIGYAQQTYVKKRGGGSSSRHNSHSRIVASVGKKLSSKITAKKKIPIDRTAKNALPKHSLLTPEEDIELEVDPMNGLRYHIVFSTDCSPYQHWQSYLVYYSSMKVKQPGHVTRIVSGCTDEEAVAMKEWFHDDVSYMSQRFHIQFTPKFSTLKNDKGEVIGDYKFFNKPFGLQYWMEHSDLLHYNNKTKTFPLTVTKDVVILIDPDMGIIRPIRADFTNPTETIISPLRKKHYNLSDVARVRPGHPFAQTYGFGTQWQRLDLEKVTGDDDTPAVKVSQLDGRLYYPVGPPYLATVGDMHNIAVHWSKFVPGVYDQYPHLLAEMFAYCIAAAHLQLPHTLIDSLMVSDVDVSGGEGWEFIDAIPETDVCDFAYHNPDHTKYPLPNVFHMCQRYTVGEDWFFSKRKMPSDIYDCDVPLFQVPPMNLATAYAFKHPPGGAKGDLSPMMAKRNAFSICFLYGLVNGAATYYKQNSCPPSIVSANYDASRNLALHARGKQK